MKLFALFRLGFPSASVLLDLNLATHNNSPAHFTKGIPSLSSGSLRFPAPIACRHTGSGLFHSPPGVLFTFPSRYCFTIGHLSYLALDHGRPKFNRNFTCSGLLRFHTQTGIIFSPTGLSPSTVGFPNTVQLKLSLVTVRKNCDPLLCDPITPAYATLAGLHVSGLGCSPFAHHYSGYLFDFFSIRLLRCFTSPTSPPRQRGSPTFAGGVAPFGHLRIKGRLRLPEAFRSLPRPSSLTNA